MRLEQYPSHILLHSARDCALWEMQNLSRGAAVAIYAIAFALRAIHSLATTCMRAMMVVVNAGPAAEFEVCGSASQEKPSQ
jgi:hypothetical protein